MACVQADRKKANLKDRAVIVLDDLDLTWLPEEVVEAVEMWASGKTIFAMAEQLRPDDQKQNSIDEVALLIMHLKRQNLIRERQHGIYGGAVIG